jgi:hypothetical protein
MAVFFISRQGYQEGPHSLELIEDKIKSGYLTPHDYIYDSKSGEWVLLSRYKETETACRSLIRNDEVTEAINQPTTDSNWYLLRDNSQSGPFDYREIIVMLHEKKAFEYDYVWCPAMSAWERVSESSYFQPDKMAPFLDGKKGNDQKHFRRKAARIEIGASLVMHNNKKLWNGTGFELSAGGGSIEVSEQPFNKGELLMVHYRPSKAVPAFNVQCEVVSCKKNSSTEKAASYRIGLRFVRVTSSTQQVLRELAAKGVA